MREVTKRLSALILAIAICLSLLSASVWAEESVLSEESTITVQSSEEAETDSLDEKETAQDAQPEEDAPKEKENAAAGEATQEKRKAEKSEEKEKDNLGIQSAHNYGSLYYFFDNDTNELTIWGTGEMPEEESESGYPWHQYRLKCYTITIQEGVTSIGAWAFADYPVCEISIPESVLTIGAGAFFSCNDLTELTLPSSLKSIGEQAFKWCDNLKKAVIPSSVESIGGGAYYACKKLATVTLNSGLKSIGKEAFWDCDSLRQIAIPDTVTAIGESAFSSCDYLERATLPRGLKTISKSLFAGDDNLWSVEIPGSVEIIGENSFSCCAMKSIVLPDVLSEIGRRAFAITEFKTLVIPASVTLIDEEALSGSDIETLVFKGSPPIMWSTSLTVGDDVSVYYPSVYADRWTEATRESCGERLVWYPYCHMENDTIVTAHSMGQGTVTKEPTYEQPGIRTYTCSYCGYSTTEIIPQLVKDPSPLSECVITLSQQYYIYDGTQKKPAVTVTDNGSVVDSSNYTLNYSANVNAGTASVRITGLNDLTGTATKTFIIAKAEQSISVELTEDEIYAGKSSNVICDGIGTLQYSSSNTSIATVNSNGKIIGVSKGTATISVLASGDSNHESALENVTITVLPAPMTKAEAEKLYAPVLDMIYYNIKTNWKYYDGDYVSNIISQYMTSKSDGKLIGYCFKDLNADGTPELMVSTEGAKNNEAIYDLYTSSGNNFYHLASSGEKYQYYLLSDGTLKEERGYGEVSDNTHFRLKKNGKKLTFLEEVYKGMEYDEDSDRSYRVIYHITDDSENPITESQMDAIVNSWGTVKSFNSDLFTKYTPNSKTAVYEVVSSSLPKTTLKSVKSAKSKSVDVTWKKNSAGKGYQIQCSTDKSFLKNVKIVNVKGNGTVKKTIKGLKKGTWYVRVCTKKGYSVSAWSSAKTVKVK